MRRWMRLFQYTRLQDLLDYFLSHQGYMSPSVLTRHFQISQRTLRSDIHNLNEELSGFDAQIIMKRSQGYALEIKEGQTRALLENMLVNEEEKQLDSADKRINTSLSRCCMPTPISHRMRWRMRCSYPSIR